MSDIIDRLPALLGGAWITVQITVYGSVLAVILAFLAGMMGTARNVVLRGIARVYVEFFRGAAALILMYWFFYALPLVGFRFTPIVAAALALGLNVGGYGAEVVRGAILSVPRAQYEATVALNFSTWQRMRRVIVPQAWAAMIPPLTNLLVQLMKGTALVSLITITDLTQVAKNWRGNSGNSALAFGVALIIYFVIAQVIVLFMRYLERRANIRLGRKVPKHKPPATKVGVPG